MLYLIKTGEKFIDYTMQELKDIANPSRLYTDIISNFIMMDSQITYEDLTKLITAATFVNNVMKVDKEISNLNSKEDLLEPIKGILIKGERFKISVSKASSKLSENAKTIEVWLGTRIESEGFTADLKSPNVLVKVVAIGSKAYIGKQPVNAYSEDWQRDLATMPRINRSELKIIEAWQYFNLENLPNGKVLDVGAAPGGWSDFMLGKGMNVVAVDGASLNYEKLGKQNILVVSSGEQHDGVDHCSKENFGECIRLAQGKRLVHLKESFDNCIDCIAKLGPYDLLLIDANTGPEVSGAIAVSASGSMRSGAQLLMTIKLIDFNISMHISRIRQILEDQFEIVAIKKLPHNRRELTLHAVKK